MTTLSRFSLLSKRELSVLQLLAEGYSNKEIAGSLATSVMVLGKKGLQLVESLAGCEAYLVSKGLAILKSVGFLEN